MKNQYYGDNKDLFKFDLIEQIMKSSLGLESFLFLPMLTPNDNSGHGEDRDRKKASAGFVNKDLLEFLHRPNNQTKKERNVREITEYFNDMKRISMLLYDYPSKNGYFSHYSRNNYFANITGQLSARSLIFMDPDTGMEVQRSRDQHVFYSEIQRVFEGMDNASLLMVIQFFHRGNHDRQIQKRASKLAEITGLLTYIGDNKIVFFFLMKKGQMRGKINKLFEEYKGTYKKVKLLDVSG